MLDKILIDPWWFAGAFALWALVFVITSISLFRNFRLLSWFYSAVFLCAAVYFFSFGYYIGFVEFLGSIRSDWSLFYLIRDFSVKSLITEFIFYAGTYGVLGVLIISVLQFWALITFRWNNLKIFFEKAYRQNWFVMFFALFTLIFHRLWFYWLGSGDIGMLQQSFGLFTFLFAFQFMIRLIDNARLDTSKVFLEFTFVSGFIFILLKFSIDWYQYYLSTSGNIHQLFISHLFSFFLVLLLIGIFVLFSIFGFFASPFFMETYFQKRGFIRSILRIYPQPKESYKNYKFLKGVFVSLMVGSFFLLINSLGLILPLIIMFFGGYFILFYFLDKQEDLRIRGNLVEKRIQSGIGRK